MSGGAHRDEGGRVPATLLTGFLGSGKTTLLNRMLARRREEVGERVAVLVNEFGDVGIDGELVIGADDEVVQLANGCLCCTVRGDLAGAVTGLLARDIAFDRLVVEASGMASPGPIAQTLEIVPELAATVELDGIVTLAHAAHVVQQLESHPEAAQQVGYADRILLNACDQASGGAADEAEAALRRVNALAPIERTRWAETDVDTLFAIGAREPGRWSLGEAHGHEHEHDHVQVHGDPEAPDAVGTVTLRAEEPLDIHRLKIWLQFVAARRTHEVLRMKGILRCQGIANAVVVQAVYQYLELGPGEAQPPEISRLVLIGRGLDAEELERGWRTVRG